MGSRKIIKDMIVIVAAFLLFVLWYQRFVQGSTQMTTTQDNKMQQVYLITTDKGYQYWGIMNQGAADMAVLMGVSYVWDAPKQRSTEQQIEIINNAVEQGAEALIVAPDDPELISTAIEAAKAKGVKIIYVDAPPNEDAISTLSTDNYKAGVQAGESVLFILQEEGKMSGSVGIINLASKANTKLREDGFRTTLEKDGRFNLLETIYMEDDDPVKAQKAAARLMMEHEDLVALFGTSEGTSIGVGNAIKDSGKEITGVGFDKTEVLMKLFREKYLKVLIAQNPYTMGYLGMAEAIAAIKEENTGPQYINTGVSVLINY
ncbi:MAG: periplasmic binding protein/LacI transcriptional regulator [Firmicutes bacterium]|nr:periplasmic binding protein/LacI transcriptional regulator [Bacillota bacterium]